MCVICYFVFALLLDRIFNFETISKPSRGMLNTVRPNRTQTRIQSKDNMHHQIIIEVLLNDHI